MKLNEKLTEGENLLLTSSFFVLTYHEIFFFNFQQILYNFLVDISIGLLIRLFKLKNFKKTAQFSF